RLARDEAGDVGLAGSLLEQPQAQEAAAEDAAQVLLDGPVAGDRLQDRGAAGVPELDEKAGVAGAAEAGPLPFTGLDRAGAVAAEARLGAVVGRQVVRLDGDAVLRPGPGERGGVQGQGRPDDALRRRAHAGPDEGEEEGVGPLVAVDGEVDEAA